MTGNDAAKEEVPTWTITIDGRECKCVKGETVLEVAKRNNIYIPTLCHHPALEPYSSCRICMVEMSKARWDDDWFKMTASCSLPVEDGMTVKTDSPKVLQARKVLMELYEARCPTSEKVKAFGDALGAEPGKYQSYSKEGEECILCGLCVNICSQTLGVHALGFAGRGSKREVAVPFDKVSDVCVTCGACSFVCPTDCIDMTTRGQNEAKPLTNEYDADLQKRGAVYKLYAQAIPNVPVIDKSACMNALEGTCKACESFCQKGALKHGEQDEEKEVNIGSVILSPGYGLFDASLKSEYGYGVFSNVVSSIEFERIMSASGPFEGHIQRLSDGETPKNIAYLQCVGSRDASCNREYCSSVCCMYAIKEAIIAQEHTPGLRSKIFYMDMRAFGKEFDDYYKRAQEEYGIEFVRCRVGGIQETGDNNNLLLSYEEDGETKTEEFDMAVLAVGFEPPRDFLEVAKKIGVEVNDYGFAKTDPFKPLDTSREGVFVSGAFSSPKDIPDTVAQASGAASRASSLICTARGTEVVKQEYPVEKDVVNVRPRIGVFVCHCGINIGSVVDVPNVVEYAKTLPNVEYAEHNLYTCSQDTQDKIKKVIEEHDLNRVVVAACTPRTHEPLFRATLRQSGLNQYLFEMANIRDQCSWVHMHEKPEATAKSKDLVRMAVAKARQLQPLKQNKMEVDKRTLVIGGGVSGMTAARALGSQGFEVYIVEKEGSLGGNAKGIFLGADMKEAGPRLDALIGSVNADPNIHVLLNSEVKDLQGFVGNFNTTVKGPDGEKEIKHGAVIMATGGSENKVTEYGSDAITQHQLESELESLEGNRFVMIQCAGSREPPNDYCSRFCCTQAVKNALRIVRRDPSAQVYVLYRDIRTYGFNELLYKECQERGVKFIRYDVDNKPKVEGKRVSVHDCVYGYDLELDVDHVVLSVGVTPNPENERFSQFLKVPLNKNGFFLEAHMKLRPVEFATQGVYLAGLAHWPKSIDESISQAEGAASRALTLLTTDFLEFEGIVSEVDPNLCVGCGMCVDACPYHAIDLEKGKAIVNEALCKGCGVCAATCRMGAAQQRNFKDGQILQMIDACFQEVMQ